MCRIQNALQNFSQIVHLFRGDSLYMHFKTQEDFEAFLNYHGLPPYEHILASIHVMNPVLAKVFSPEHPCAVCAVSDNMRWIATYAPEKMHVVDVSVEYVQNAIRELRVCSTCGKGGVMVVCPRCMRRQYCSFQCKKPHECSLMENFIAFSELKTNEEKVAFIKREFLL